MPNLLQKIWQKTPETLSLSTHHIDVWLCHLKQISGDINDFYSILSEDEHACADKLKVEAKRQQYVITRGVLRQRLGLLTKIDPEDFVFEYLEHGKPVLINDVRFAGITFNVSHSYDLALIAISINHHIGVDIEKINIDSDHQQLVKRFFSKAEQHEFNTLSETVRVKAFCACWTRKEAFIKATGDGVTYGLDAFDVTVDPENQTPEINLHKPSEESWSALNLLINDDYMACLVSNGGDVDVRCWR